MGKAESPVTLERAKKGLTLLDKLAKTASNSGRLFMVLAGSVDRRLQAAVMAANVTRAGINAIKAITDGPKLLDLFRKEKKDHMRQQVETAAIATFRIMYVARTAGELANFIRPMPGLGPLIGQIGLAMRSPTLAICMIGVLDATHPLDEKKIDERVLGGVGSGLDLTVLVAGGLVPWEGFGPAMGTVSGVLGTAKATLALFR